MIKDHTKGTKLSELGEFGLINHLTSNIKLKHKSTIKGIGDDAAVLDYKDNKTIISTDMLIEGIHFDLTYTPLKHLGYKAVISNLSDICAMNAQPKQITVSIAISEKFSLEAMEEIYKGIYLACDNYNIDLIGGDTTSSLTGMCICITVIGEGNDDKITYRNTANENDLICVTGNLGAAYMGLQLLEREKKLFNENPEVQPNLEGYDYILERQLKPEARLDIIKTLEEKNITPTAMIDISDGLASEAMHICNDSNKGCLIYEEKIPIDYQTHKMAEEFNMSSTICALNGGEDYELLFTVPLDQHDKIKDLQDIKIIGHVTSKEEGCKLQTRDGNTLELKAQGWTNFNQ